MFIAISRNFYDVFRDIEFGIYEPSSDKKIIAQTIHDDDDRFRHFVADHELGQLNGLTTILALDMWEHAYMVDYTPAEKAKYIDAFFKNLDGGVAEARFTA
jgi:superoxide dismutase